MAWIYEFGFLCENLLEAERLRLYFTENRRKSSRPDLYPEDAYETTIGGQSCKILLNSHKELSLDEKDDGEHWVSVIPYENGKFKWALGDPHPSESANFTQAMSKEIFKMPSRVGFLYASPGAEVSGFRSKKEVIELLNTNCELDGAFIHNKLWDQVKEPINWMYFNNEIWQYGKLLKPAFL